MLPAKTRLGRVQRRLLLAAPSSDAVGGHDPKWVPLLPAGPTESEQEAPRNAARRLEGHGLLEVTKRESSGEDAARFLLGACGAPPREVEWACRKRGAASVWRSRTTVWLVRRTVFGDDFLGAYREELLSAVGDEPLKPFRWR